MRTDKSLTVFKYFDLADRFVRVRVLDPAASGLRIGAGMTRSEYRQSVILLCMEEIENDLKSHLLALHPADPLAAEDHLYQLCVSVNPGLEIHTISLSDGETPERADTELQRSGPGSRLETRLRRKMSSLGERLRESVIGQDDAVARVVESVRRVAAGLNEEERPLASFLFVGRTGTGKTQLARSLANVLFGAPESFIRVDCSEFAMAHETSKLIGAPPGYVGHGDGGQLTEALLKQPESVVLFDEIEKAHPRMHSLLLQVLDEGHLTDSKGRQVSFDRSFVIMTANSGAQKVQEQSQRVGFQGSVALSNRAVQEVMSAELQRQFTPEFLGRIDDTVPFRGLELEDARRIARLQLGDLAGRVRRRKMRVAFTPAVAGWVAAEGFRPESGARELRRVIRREIEAPLAAEILNAGRGAKGWIRVSIRAGEPRFERED